MDINMDLGPPPDLTQDAFPDRDTHSALHDPYQPPISSPDREQYRVPASVPAATAGQPGAGAAIAVGGGSDDPARLVLEDPAAYVKYTCGDCACIQTLNRSSSSQTPMQCRECGGRMFYKLRTKRMIQFEAR